MQKEINGWKNQAATFDRTSRKYFTKNKELTEYSFHCGYTESYDKKHGEKDWESIYIEKDTIYCINYSNSKTKRRFFAWFEKRKDAYTFLRGFLKADFMLN